jgi:hypothetical protein
MKQKTTDDLMNLADKTCHESGVSKDTKTICLTLLALAHPLYAIHEELEGLRERITAVTVADGE